MENLPYEPVEHNHEAFLRKANEDPEFRKAYAELTPQYALLEELLRARHNAGMTQEAVAQKIGTTKSAISRLESTGKHAPSFNTLAKYAEAVGCKLVVKLEPKRQRESA